MTTRDTDNNPEIAATIRAQLGHGAFVMMGARDLLDIGNGLRWKVGRNAKGVTHVSVVLSPDDTYAVTFHKVRGTSWKVSAEFEGVYVDSLKTTIEMSTGLYLSL